MNERSGQINLTIIGEGMEITGELWSSDDIRIDGRFDGELGTKGRIVISRKGFVKGNISGQNINIQGKAEGDFEAKNNFQIAPGGSFRGSVKTRFINITESAYFNGTCNIFPQKDISSHRMGRKISVSGIGNEKFSDQPISSGREKSCTKNIENPVDDQIGKNKEAKENVTRKESEASLLKNKISQIQSF